MSSPEGFMRFQKRNSTERASNVEKGGSTIWTLPKNSNIAFTLVGSGQRNRIWLSSTCWLVRGKDGPRLPKKQETPGLSTKSKIDLRPSCSGKKKNTQPSATKTYYSKHIWIPQLQPNIWKEKSHKITKKSKSSKKWKSPKIRKDWTRKAWSKKKIARSQTKESRINMCHILLALLIFLKFTLPGTSTSPSRPSRQLCLTSSTSHLSVRSTLTFQASFIVLGSRAIKVIIIDNMIQYSLWWI